MQKYLPVLRSCPFFTGLTDDEILSILHCVSAAKITRPRGSYIFRAGDSTEVMGLMLSGSTLVIQEDLWGHRNILSKCNTGDFFGEPYAATPGAILNISVVAEEDCEILLLNVKRLLTSCPTACDHHQKLIRNLVSVLANKILLFNDTLWLSSPFPKINFLHGIKAVNYIFIPIVYMYILFESNDSVNCINTQKMEIDFYESSGLQSILQ